VIEARWYFDFISPFAYLQLRRILALRERIRITPMPIVFGAVLAHHGQLGPAEIAGKPGRQRQDDDGDCREDQPLQTPSPCRHEFVRHAASLPLAMLCGIPHDIKRPERKSAQVNSRVFTGG
jgi:hypothetical protein